MMVHEVLIDVIGRDEAETVYNNSYDSHLSVMYNKPVFRMKDFCETLKIPQDSLNTILLQVICKNDEVKFNFLKEHIYNINKIEDNKTL